MRFALLVVPLMLVAGCAEDPQGGAPTTAAPSPSPTPLPTPQATPTMVTPPATPAGAGPTGSPVPMPGENEVYIWGLAFVNETTTVMAGSTVAWTNMNPLTHTITADDGSFDSGDVRSEYGFSQTFGTPGNYSYHCRIHPSMRGSIEVLRDEVVVLEPPAPNVSVNVNVSGATKFVEPGKRASYNVTMTNTGAVSREFEASFVIADAGGRNWGIEMVSDAVRLAPGAARTVPVTIVAPSDAQGNDRAMIVVTARSVPEVSNEQAASANLTLFAVVVAPPPPPAPTQVNIQGFAFAPTPLSVAVGATVRWTNLDVAPHTATANGGAFDTGTLENGASAQHTFSAAGAFPYFCAVHPSMTGTITVG